MKPLGKVTLDVEMETGTGKTFVYTKAMFALNEKYGWSKFIVIVPNIAIREGVYKSIQTTESYFMEEYGKKIRAFIYDSSDLTKVDDFAKNSGINVMIINSQAFARDFDESKSDIDGAKKKKLIIFDRRDEFASRKPIDIIRSTHPILILDEPQKLGKTGSVTQKSLREHFDALFSMNFSATHEEEHNKIYSLDALDAYKHKLVKKIAVKGIKINHLPGSEGYIYVEGIEVSGGSPKVRLEINVKRGREIKKETKLFGYKGNLFQESDIEAYRGIYITEINALENTVSFSNGFVLHPGDSVCDILEEDKRRIQIRETILSHLHRESELFHKGIKVLSLFFIDEVANYRKYSESGEQLLGDYGVMFEEEYRQIIRERSHFYDPEYIASLPEDVSSIHTGYFSIDKKGRMVNSEVKKGYEGSSDVDAYDLILRNKEELLSRRNPVRFIFSHSALSEGWDNPNVFQICALKHSDSNTRRRQEVGRGMRICVNQKGERQDVDALGPDFFKVNSLTVIADEDYQKFVDGLQKEINAVIRPRSEPITPQVLQQKFTLYEKGEVNLETRESNILHIYLTSNQYIDYDFMPTDKFREAAQNNQFAPLPLELCSKAESINNVLRHIAAPESIDGMIEDGRKVKIRSNDINDENFKKFLKLWNEINHRYHYKVSFDSDELIGNAIAHINDKLNIAALSYTVTEGVQRDEITYQQSLDMQGFSPAKTSTKILENSHIDVKYDLIGKIAAKTILTRKTVAAILKSIENKKFDMFKANPEEFIEQVSRLINEEKSSIVIGHIDYNIVDGEFDRDIFTLRDVDIDKVYEAKKNVQKYVSFDSKGELNFAKEMDAAEQVVVYAKLPDGKNGFYIPTPMGNYSPDWAIAFSEDEFRHIFFVAETKGSLSSLDLSPIEQNKIRCAEKLFKKFNGDAIYHQTDNYKELISFVIGQNQ